MKPLVAVAAALTLAFAACFVRPDADADPCPACGDGGSAEPTAVAEAGATAVTQGGGSDAALSTECVGYDPSTAPQLADAGGIFLATGVGQRATFSPDGVHWQTNQYVAPVADAAAFEGDIQATAVGNGMVVAASSTGIMTSADGLTWTQRELPEVRRYVRYDNGFGAVAYGKGVFVVGAGPRFNPLAFFHSSDGIEWPTPTVVNEAACCRSINAITFAADQFVAVGAGRRTVVSDDGITWRDDKLGSEDTGLVYTAVAFGNGTWVTVGTHSILAWSSNGKDWTDATQPDVIGDFRNLLFDGTKFLTCARLACYTSLDGKSWQQAPGTINDPRPTAALVVRNGVFVGLDPPATLLTSADGLAWTPVYCGESPLLTSLTFVPR